MQYNYQLIRSKRKTVALKIEDGQIFVYAPLHLSQAKIDEMVLRHNSWIRKKLENPRINLNYDLENDESIYVMGHKYNLIVQTGLKSNMYIRDNTIHLEGRSLNTIQKTFREYLEGIVLQQVLKIKVKTGIEFDLNFKKFTSKWGCCNKDKQLIVMNYLCGCLPIDIIQGVIYHEMAHLKVSNHQKDFYHYLEVLCPDYKIRAKQLKEYSL